MATAAKPAPPVWKGSGTQLVARILIRRRLKCQRAGTHQTAHCRACGASPRVPGWG